MTIVVALVGYRLLLGAGFALREGLGLALRLGAVLALASQWPAYRAWFSTLFTRARPELAGALLGQSGLAAPGWGIGRAGGRVNAAVADLVHPQVPPAAQQQLQPGQAPGQLGAPQTTPQGDASVARNRAAFGRGATGL